MQKFDRVEGNKEVIELLEEYLEDARKGTTNFAGVFTVEGTRFSGNYVGDLKAFHVGFFALDYLQQRMRALANVEPVRLADCGAVSPANAVVYNLTTEPVCHDFIVWLVTALMQMWREGADPPLHVRFIRGRNLGARESDFCRDVMLPALELFGAVHDSIALEGRSLNVYTPRVICEAARRGEDVPRISVPEHAMEAVRLFMASELKSDAPVTTITLREADTYPHRNSNIPEWCKFARWLESRGERVIFVRDTAKADEPLEGFRTFPAGSRKAILRAALYEQAKCNCFVSNGPLGWALFGVRPWLAFHTVSDDEPSECNTPAWWKRCHGIVPGEQYPWSSPQQRLVYAEDNFDNLCAAWEQHMHPGGRTLEHAAA